MICAACGETVSAVDPCARCGRDGRLADRYVLLEVVGHGATGTTYRARRDADGSVVAIKELLVRQVAAAKALELFEREARVLAGLAHPGIPAVHDSFSAGQDRSLGLYLVQDFVEGQTLLRELELRFFDEREVFAIAIELLDVLAYLAERRPPVVHRDLKPANIMRRRHDGKLLLIDFGCVRAAVDQPVGGSTVAGTFGYMAPEQLQGRALPASDLYGLAATAVHLLARRDPQTLMDLEHRLRLDEVPLQDPALREVLEWMLRRDPEQRPQDARALARELRSILDGTPRALAPRTASLTALVPPPPRALPAGFARTHATFARFQILFGTLFGTVGTAAGVLPTLLVLSVPGLSLLAGLATSAALIGLFGGIGGMALLRGRRALARARALYEHGQAVPGELIEIGWSTYAVNHQRARRYRYRFTLDGAAHEGWTDSLRELAVREGDAVAVLVDPQDPQHSALHLDAL